MRSVALLLAAVVLATGPVGRANPFPKSFTATTWRVEEGLPDDSVQALAETPDGSLWIGTSGGLARFDGNRFTIYKSDNTSAFRENSVHCLTVARDGTLWIGMEGGGLIHYAHGSFRVYTAADGLADMFVHAIAEDRGGSLWIGSNNGLFRLANGRLQRVDGANGVPLMAVNAIQEDASGRVWAGGSRLISIGDGVFEEHSLPGELSRNRIKSLLISKDGAIWVGTVSGLYRSPDGKASFARLPGVRGTVRVLRQDDEGTLWMSIVGQGAEAWPLDREGRLAGMAMRIAGTILSIFEDQERNLWVGAASGITRFSETPVSVISIPGFRNSDFATVYLDRDGILWTAGTFLARISGGRAEPHIFGALHGTKVRNLLQDRDGSLWIGSDGSGLFHLAKGSVLRYTTAQGLVNNFIRVLVQARDGSLWIGTDEGVSHFSGGRFRNYGIRDGLAYFGIRSMMEDRQGGLWIGTDLGLSHLVDGRVVVDRSVEALRQEKIWAIQEDTDGGLWFGTRNRGLWRWRDGQLVQYTSGDGLASNAVYAILEDRAGRLWLSGPDGVSSLNRSELDAAANEPAGKPRHLLSLEFYSLPDADGPAQIFGGVQSAGAVATNGDIWFPSNHGPVRISQPRAEPSRMPPLLFEEVDADHIKGSWSAGSRSIELGPANSRLDISFGPLMLSPQQNFRFRYKLEGFDREWLDALGRRDSSYANLPPGRYVFHVAAFRTSDPDEFSEASLVVIKGPYFYRRWWFLACVTLALLGAAFGVYRVRISRMRQRFIGVLEERNRIAREIHDTIIQGCTSVSAVLEAVTTISSAETRESLLDRARTQIRITIDEARQAVWNLRQEAEPKTSLNTRLCALCAQIEAEFEFPSQCVISGKPFQLTRSTMHEVLMIVREALHNAAQHASPTTIQVTATFGHNDVSIEIADDGRGFDPEAPLLRRRHFGLLGMRERAARLHAEIEFKSRPGQGTRVVLRIPSLRRIREATLAERVEAL